MDPEAVVEGTVDAGLPVEESTPSDTGSTESAEMFTVKVDGQDLQVSRDELLNGYSRQQDYTRKTQQLAAEREQYSQLAALAAALERDPGSTLDALREAYGLNEPAAPLDPEEARIAQLERFMADQQEAARQAAMDRQIASLQQRFGDVDEVKLLEHAIQHGIPDLEAAFAHMNFESVFQAKKAAEAKEKEEQGRIDAKRDAGVVEGGSNRQAGSTTPGDAGKKLSFAEAYALAKQQHGDVF